MNFAISALLDLLSAAPVALADIQTAVTAWHNAHGDQAKTAVAVNTATQIIAAAGAIATTIEPTATNLNPQPGSPVTSDTGATKIGGGAIVF